MLKVKTAELGALNPFLKPLNLEASNRGGCLSRKPHKTWAPLFLQKDIEQRVVNPNLAVSVSQEGLKV